mgnify:CR=1 FL=1
MHKADFKEITTDDVVRIASGMKSKGCSIVTITGYVDKESRPVVAYSYDVNGNVETYSLRGENVIPSITGIYGIAAEWFEEEITELMKVDFDGLDNKGRLFLPEEFDGSGQILVTPMSELVNKKE